MFYLQSRCLSKLKYNQASQTEVISSLVWSCECIIVSMSNLYLNVIIWHAYSLHKLLSSSTESTKKQVLIKITKILEGPDESWSRSWKAKLRRMQMLGNTRPNTCSPAIFTWICHYPNTVPEARYRAVRLKFPCPMAAPVLPLARRSNITHSRPSCPLTLGVRIATPRASALVIEKIFKMHGT